MAINDVSLTSGMRANLLNLQNTVNLLDRTQSRLASGKKVNSAIDNPVSYFASQALTSRAGVIDSLKDAMGQAVSTIQSADKGISSITALIEQAKGIAQQALSADFSAGFDTDEVTINSLAVGDSISIGGTALTAGPTAVTTSTTYNNFTITASGVDDADTVTVGGVTFTAVATTASTTTYNSFSVDFTGIANGDTVTVGGVAYTGVSTTAGMASNEFYTGGTDAEAATSLKSQVDTYQAGAYNVADNLGGVLTVTAGTSSLTSTSVQETGGATITPSTTVTYAATTATQFLIGASNNASATNLQAKLSSYFGTGYNVARLNNVITVTAGTTSLNATTAVQADADLAVASATTVTTAPGALAATEFAVTGDDIIDAQALATLINNNATITAANYSASASNGVLTISNSAADIAAGDVTVTNATAMVESTVAGTSELSDLVAQYNTVLNQLSELAEDSGYKGKNLLSATTGLRTLEVKFEGTTLTVNGFDATATGMGVTNALNGATTTWTAAGQEVTNINSSIDQLDAALVTLRQQSSKMSGNLSIITVRQDFSTNMINTLTAGADKLTLADANEEGANMLMLQTRQSLSTSALSMSAQAAQSVLRLFQ